MFFAFAFGVDKNVIKVHYHENIKLFCQDHIDITLERCWYVGQFKRHDMVLKVAISGAEGCILFVAFSDPHLMRDIGQLELDEMLSPT